MAKAAASDLFEIEAARIALARSRDAEIRSFASQMIGAHKNTAAALAATLAKDRLARPPATLDEDHGRLIADLESARPEEFDTLFLDQQETAHREALGLMQAYGAAGDNADLRTFAGDTAPKVQGHLTMARSLIRAGARGGASRPGA